MEERPQGVSLAYVLASSLAVLLGMVIGGFVSILILMQLLR